MPEAEAATQGRGVTAAEDTLNDKSRDARVICGGHLVAKPPLSEGADMIFTLCGGHIMDISDGGIDERIRIIDVRHGQAAAHAADGYARQQATGNAAMTAQTAAT